MKLLLKVNRGLRFFGLGSAKLMEMESQLKGLEQQMTELATYPAMFNQRLSAEGWLAHDSMDFTVLKNAVDAFDAHGKDAAVSLLLDYYGADAVAGRLFFLNGVEEFRPRWRFIEFALQDYKAGRYYSCIPLLIMVMDGAVNDAVGSGLHAEKTDLDAWDCLTTADGSIQNIKSIFQRNRKKTRTEPIYMPFRNGILHGMDLGYDNQIVAAKCWSFLFVVKDWIRAKQTESERQRKLEDERRVPSLKELGAQLRKNASLKQSTADWRPREIAPAFILGLNSGSVPDPASPECVAMAVLSLWAKKNYGHMANHFWRLKDYGGNPAQQVREQYGWRDVSRFTVLSITDVAPAAAEMVVSLHNSKDGGKPFKVRLIREDEDGSPVPAGTPGGTWLLVHILPVEDATPCDEGGRKG
ncbi:MAG: hypothetical protein K8T26_01505 [Lentisphaerae bacterium]|nr:hypothetical protein [Lentisphaerota bacterium]